MAIQDFFAISGRDPVVTGHVDTGSVRVGDQLVVRRSGAADVEVVATAIEMFRKGTDQAFAGDNIGLYVQLSSKNPRELLQRGGLVIGAKSSPSTPPAATIEYVVWMESAGGSKINVIKAVRELTGLSLKDAKDLVEKAPVKVLATMVKADAESAKAKLEAAGATVTLKELPK